jgi:chromosome partitioning protein
MFTYKSKVLAVLNQKGGVGKTTVASVIAEYTAIVAHKSVLVVDLDMQCNSSDYWVGMESAPQATGGQLPPLHPDYDGDPDLDSRSSIADIFFGKAVLPHSTYIKEENGFKKNVEIMVGHPALLERINSEFDNASGKIGSMIIDRLGEFLHMQDVADTYDLIILDTGPSRNPIFRSAVRAATHAIIPFEPEEKSLQGINAMLQVIQSENFSRNDADQLKLIGLCPNKVRANTNIHRSTLEMLHTQLGKVMFPSNVYLPQSTAFPERDLKGISPRSIFQISAQHAAFKQSSAVGEYVTKHIFN